MANKREPVRVHPILIHPNERRVSLDGQWYFQLDPEDKGISKGWYSNSNVFSEKINVPGCWQGQGFGSNNKDTVWDFGFEARTFRATYKGTGWYYKSFKVPEDWKGLYTWINFGAVHPSAEVWINGGKLGENHAPFVPFGFDITKLIQFDKENFVVVRVHEQARQMGFSFNWLGNWSGLYRSVELTATGTYFLDQFRIYPDVDSQKIKFKVKIGGVDHLRKLLTLLVSAKAIGSDSPGVNAEIQITTAETKFETSVSNPRLWSPDDPNLYQVDAILAYNGQVMDALSDRAGFVKLSTKDNKFLINDEPYYIRGTGDFNICPETVSPDTDRDRWRKKLKTLRSYGYNQVRCQSYVPAPEYFDVADEVGLLIQSEMGMLGAWSGHSNWHIYAWPQPTPEVREDLKKQWDLVVLRDVNHPSANMYCMSNELPAFSDEVRYQRIAWQCYNDTKRVKPTAFVIWTDGRFDENMPGDFINENMPVDVLDEPSAKEFVKRMEKTGKPIIQHEYRWWSAFPDVRNIRKFSGAMRPFAAEIALEAARRHGISHVLPQAAANSQRLQYIEAKTKMEICRRDFPQLAGISHFCAMDCIVSPQGIFDEFYELKYADGNTWNQTNGDTVILSSFGFDDRALEVGNRLKCRFFVSDFSHPAFGKPVLEWELNSLNKVLAKGKISYKHKAYTTCKAGRVEIVIPDVSKPVSAILRVTLREDKRVVTNQWNLWLFPCATSLPPSIAIYEKPEYTWIKSVKGLELVSAAELNKYRLIVAERFDKKLAEFARVGGRVILAATEGLQRRFGPKLGGVVGHYFFTPPANYGPYEDGHDGTIIAKHPMLGDFPHAGFADFQFFRMMGKSPAIDLEPLDLHRSEPVIRVMHSYSVCRPLGYLVERSIGKGELIICSLELNQSWVEAQYLFQQLCSYACSERFAPERKLSEKAEEQIISGTCLP